MATKQPGAAANYIVKVTTPGVRLPIPMRSAVIYMIRGGIKGSESPLYPVRLVSQEADGEQNEKKQVERIRS